MNNNNKQDKEYSLPYKYCLNCGTELNGMFCHKCGQQATSKTPSIGEFIKEYINNAFIWDSKCLKTIWTLLRRPGYLTTEFLKGKFSSYEHPLKLNMFLLFLFVTLFLLFSDTEKISNSLHNLTSDEKVFPSVQMSILISDPEYSELLKEGPRDTILLSAPLSLAEEYPEIIINYETIEETNGETLDRWTAILPHILIEDRIIVADSSGYYIFNNEFETKNNPILILSKIWNEMVRLLAKYFPIMVLFTAPLLTLSLRLVQRSKGISRINHFIFSLHYIAFLELLMLGIYILHLTVGIPSGILQYVVSIASCVYLTIAFNRVYNPGRWFSSIIKAMITSIIYLLITMIMFFIIIIIAFVSVIVTLL